MAEKRAAFTLTSDGVPLTAEGVPPLAGASCFAGRRNITRTGAHRRRRHLERCWFRGRGGHGMIRWVEIELGGLSGWKNSWLGIVAAPKRVLFDGWCWTSECMIYSTVSKW